MCGDGTTHDWSMHLEQTKENYTNNSGYSSSDDWSTYKHKKLKVKQHFQIEVHLLVVTSVAWILPPVRCMEGTSQIELKEFFCLQSDKSWSFEDTNLVGPKLVMTFFSFNLQERRCMRLSCWKSTIALWSNWFHLCLIQPNILKIRPGISNISLVSLTDKVPIYFIIKD